MAEITKKLQMISLAEVIFRVLQRDQPGVLVGGTDISATVTTGT